MRTTFLSRFSRGGLAVLVILAVVVCLGVGGTYAYLTTTTNQVENSVSTGAVALALYENDNLVTTGSELSSTLGQASKKVQLENPAGDHNVPVYVRVSIVPEVVEPQYDSISKTYEDANVFMDETWPESFTETSMDLGLVTLYFNSNWANYWTYSNGAFVSKEALAVGTKTQPLLMGVDWKTGTTDVEKENRTIRVNVIAEAVQTAAKSDAFGS